MYLSETSRGGVTGNLYEYCSNVGSYPMGTGGPFPGGKARLGRDADQSP
jgi:hypothetical protein